MEFKQLAPFLAMLTKLDVQHIIKAGGCQFHYQDNLSMVIEWEEKANKLIFYSSLLHVSIDQAERVYDALLENHLFGQLTQGAYFGLHDSRDEILLFRVLSLQYLDESQFFIAVNDFLAQAEHWQQTLSLIHFKNEDTHVPCVNLV